MHRYVLRKINKNYFLYIRYLIINENENDNNTIIIINNPQNEKFREKLKNILPIITKNRRKK